MIGVSREAADWPGTTSLLRFNRSTRSNDQNLWMALGGVT
jgi:hypothetical protein